VCFTVSDVGGWSPTHGGRGVTRPCFACPAIFDSSLLDQNRDFCLYPTCIRPPVRGFTVPSEYRHPIWYGKTRMVRLPDGEKKFEDMFIRFDIIHERDGDRQTPSDGYSHAYAWHRTAKLSKNSRSDQRKASHNRPSLNTPLAVVTRAGTGRPYRLSTAECTVAPACYNCKPRRRMTPRQHFLYW